MFDLESPFNLNIRIQNTNCDKSHPYACARGNRVKEPGGSATSTEGLCVCVGPFPKIPSASHACMHTQ